MPTKGNQPDVPSDSLTANEPVDTPESSLPESSSEPDTKPEPEPIKEDNWSLLLVNSVSPLASDFDVELEVITDNYRVDARIAESLRKMFNKAREDGIELMICSAYRPIAKQEELFEKQKRKHIANGMDNDEAETQAATLVARPGTSEHHTGLAVDIVTPTYQNLDEGFEDTAAFGWLSENVADFGFILRYPKGKESITQISYEPWHYRYVGIENAKKIQEAGYCLEEYLYVALMEKEKKPESSQSDVSDISVPSSQE